MRFGYIHAAVKLTQVYPFKGGKPQLFSPLPTGKHAFLKESIDGVSIDRVRLVSCIFGNKRLVVIYGTETKDRV